MRVDFSLRSQPGHVDVEFSPANDRQELGASPGAAGLPMCEATITYPGRGYTGLLGWIQMVRSTDNRSGGRQFEMDPLEVLGDVPHPFAFFGIKPTLFDAPSRPEQHTTVWTAHSFLTVISNERERQVAALLGFSWGFTMSTGQVSLIPPETLEAETWNAHRPLLTAHYPDWAFMPNFQGS